MTGRSILRAVTCGLGTVMLMAAAPASARPDTVLSCAADTLGDGFATQLGQLMTAENSDPKEVDRLFDILTKASDDCGTRAGMEADELRAFFNYNMGRIAREWMAAQISSYGVQPVVVDRAVDLGPGLTNPSLESGLSDEMIDKIVSAVADSGVDTDAITPDAWGMVGSYLAATSAMWKAHDELKP